MVGLKTFTTAIAFLALAGQARPDPPDLPEMVRTFAYCAGRLSAEMQHQWLLSDPRSGETEAVRAAMIDLLEAAQPEGAGPWVLTYRTAARQAHSALLSQATFGDDSREAAWARRRAEAELGYCLELMLR